MEHILHNYNSFTDELFSGLDILHELTKNNEYEMRVDMEDFDNETRYAVYGLVVYIQNSLVSILDYSTI